MRKQMNTKGNLRLIPGTDIKIFQQNNYTTRSNKIYHKKNGLSGYIDYI